MQVCNLSEVVIRDTDTFEMIANKVRIATFIGTVQSTFTNFRYLRAKWKHNCEEERLLGVSFTGIMDNPSMYGSRIDGNLAGQLDTLRTIAIDTNKEIAEQLGINQSSSITAVKPSGTVSQLVDSASGIHPRFSEHYIRRVRNDVKDPVSTFLINAGVPYEVDNTNPSAYVFSFPMAAPEGSCTVADVTAIQQLELWKLYQLNWCEHKPSITVYVKDDEWLKVAAWVYENFDIVSGISFLPYSDHVYPQAPYESIDKDKYDELVASFPVLDWSKLPEFELGTDTTTGSQEFACVSGQCEI